MNRTEPKDFRLVYDNALGLYRDQTDGSLWQNWELFDFGWGREPGYCKLPLPSTAEMLELLLNASIEDDYYGAASILLEERAEEALPGLEAALQNAATSQRAAQRYNEVGLRQAVNRSEIKGKSADNVQVDFERWQALSAMITATMKQDEKTSFWKRLFHKSR